MLTHDERRAGRGYGIDEWRDEIQQKTGRLSIEKTLVVDDQDSKNMDAVLSMTADGCYGTSVRSNTASVSAKIE